MSARSRLMSLLRANAIRSLLAAAALSALAVGLAFVLPTPARAAAPVTSGLVLQDNLPLRAAPKDSAPQHVGLQRGEALELRGAQGDWLQVWDHGRERGGFVRAAGVLRIAVNTPPVEQLSQLSAQLRLARAQPGAEGLALGLVAAVAERASADWLSSPAGAELLDALGELQERVADRANRAGGAAPAAAITAQLDVARRYGWSPLSVAQTDGSQRLCAKPDSSAQLLALADLAEPDARARAALRLTRPDCIAPDLLPSQRAALDAWRAELLGKLDGPLLSAMSPHWRNRLLLRRASVSASLAFARRADAVARKAAAEQAWSAWSRVAPAALSEDDSAAQRDAALRLAPLRWALLPEPTGTQRWGRLQLDMQPGADGQQCLRLGWLEGDTVSLKAQRCTHAQVWRASARPAPDGRAIVLAVQPLDGWTELWRLDAAASNPEQAITVLPPAAAQPGLGVAEWAGWAKGPQNGLQLLVAREAEAEGRTTRRFEVYGGDLQQAPVRWANEPQPLAAFERAGDPAWRAASTLLR